MQTASLSNRWSKSFLKATASIKAIAGLPYYVYRTFKLAKLCKRLADEDVHFDMDERPEWITFLGLTIPKFCSHRQYHTVGKVWMYAECYQFTSNTYESLKRALVLLRELPSINEIQIRFYKPVDDGATLTDALAPLAEIKSLRSLDVSSHHDDDDSAFLALPHLPQLRMFTYTSGKLSDTSLNQFEKISNVESLRLWGQFTGVRDLKPIAALKSLDAIQLTPHSNLPLSAFDCFAGHLTLKYFECGELSDEILEILATCPNLCIISSFDSSVTDKGLTHLTRMKRLRCVDLGRSLITDEGFPTLAACQSLDHLYCNNCKLTDAIGPTLSQLSNLRFLRLWSTMITEKLIPYLIDLPELEAVEFGVMPLHIDVALAFGKRMRPREADGWWMTTWYEIYYRLGGDPSATLPYKSEDLNLRNIRGLRGRIASIRRLSDIKCARLENTDVDDQDLQALATGSQLSFLNISHTAITAEGLGALSNQRSLERLIIGPFNDLPAAIASLVKIPAVNRLDIVGGTRLDAECVRLLSKLTNISSLHLKDMAYDEDTALQLCHIEKLEYIGWRGHDSFEQDIAKLRMQSAQVSNVAAIQPQLRQTSSLGSVVISNESELGLLDGCSVSHLSVAGINLTAQGVASISKIKGIRELDLSGTGITDIDITTLSGALTTVQRLNISNNAISDVAVVHVIQCPRIRYLDLSSTRITNAGFSKVLESMLLWELDVSNTQITEEAWTLYRGDAPSKCRMVMLNSVASFNRILHKIPNAKFKNTSLACGNAVFDRSTLLVLQGLRDPSCLARILITPELLEVWTAEEVFDKKDLLMHLSIQATGKVSRLLEMADAESLKSRG